MFRTSLIIMIIETYPIIKKKNSREALNCKKNNNILTTTKGPSIFIVLPWWYRFKQTGSLPLQFVALISRRIPNEFVRVRSKDKRFLFRVYSLTESEIDPGFAGSRSFAPFLHFFLHCGKSVCLHFENFTRCTCWFYLSYKCIGSIW